MDYLKANNNSKYMLRRNSDTVLAKSNIFLNPVENENLLLPLQVQVVEQCPRTPSPSPSVNSQSQSPVSPSSPSPSIKSNKTLLNQKLFNLVHKIESHDEAPKTRTSSISSTSASKVVLQCFQNINNKIRKRHSVSILKLNSQENRQPTFHSKNNSNNKLDIAYNHLSYQTLSIANVPNLLVSHLKNSDQMAPNQPVSPLKVKDKFKKSFKFKPTQSLTSKRRHKRSKSAPINQRKRLLAHKYSASIIDDDLKCKLCARKLERRPIQIKENFDFSNG